MTRIGFTPGRPVAAEDVRDLQRLTSHDSAGSGGRRLQVLKRAFGPAQGGTGHMGVTRRGVEPGVAEQDLDQSDIDLLFQQMGGETVPERVQADLTSHAPSLRVPLKRYTKQRGPLLWTTGTTRNTGYCFIEGGVFLLRPLVCFYSGVDIDNMKILATIGFYLFLVGCSTPQFRAEEAGCTSTWMAKIPPNYVQEMYNQTMTRQVPTGYTTCTGYGYSITCTESMRTEYYTVPAVRTVDTQKAGRDAQIGSCTQAACFSKYGNSECKP